MNESGARSVFASSLAHLLTDDDAGLRGGTEPGHLPVV